MLAVFLTGLISFHQVNITGNQLMATAMKESRNVSVDQSRTNISIQNNSFDPDSCMLALHVKNTGSTSITSFHLMDLIIQVQGGNAFVARPDYIESSEGLLRGTWKIEASLEDPEFEPGIFNPGEIVEIQTLLDIPEQGDTIGRIMIVTANGVSTEAPLGLLSTPC